MNFKIHKKHLITKCEMWTMDACLFIGIILIWCQGDTGLSTLQEAHCCLCLECPHLHPGLPSFLTLTTSYQSFRTWCRGNLLKKTPPLCFQSKLCVSLFTSYPVGLPAISSCLFPLIPVDLSYSPLVPWYLTRVPRHGKQTVHACWMNQWRLLWVRRLEGS